MSKAISVDLRERIVRAVQEEDMPQPAVARRFAVSLASVKRYLAQARTTGDLTPRTIPGRAPVIGDGQYAAVVALLAAHPDATLAAQRDQWQQQTGVKVSESTWCRMRRRVGWTRKKRR